MDASKLKNIQNNANDIQDYLVGLTNWEKDIKKKDEKLLAVESNGQNIEEEKNAYPIRSQKTSTGGIVKEVKPATNGSSKKISAFDYAAWDKFDVDSALESVDKPVASKRPSPAVKTADKRGPAAASPATGGPTQENKLKAVKLKDEGNELYSAGSYSAAEERYSEGLDLDPTNHVLYANRALIHIKQGSVAAAEQDCNSCLALCPGYLKAYLRRAAVRQLRGDLQAALLDLNKVLEAEPGNKDAKRQLHDVQKRISSSKPAPTRKSSSRLDHKDVSSTNTSTKGKREKTLENQSRQSNSTTASGQRTGTSSSRAASVKLTGTNVSAVIPGPSVGHSSVTTPGQPPTTVTDPDILLPAERPLQQRSQEPLLKVAIVDVPSMADVPSFRSQQRAMKKEEHLDQSNKRKEEEMASTASAAHSVSPAQLPLAQQPLAQLASSLSSASPPPSTTSSSSPIKASDSSQSPASPQSVTAPPAVQSAVVEAGGGPCPALPPVPRTSHQFQCSWGRVADHPQLSHTWLTSLKPSLVRGFEMEVECIASLVSGISSWLSDQFLITTSSNDKDATGASDRVLLARAAASYLEAITSSSSFQLNVLFMTQQDKTGVLQLLDQLRQMLGSLSVDLDAARTLVS